MFLVSIDVDSLYTNIRQKDAITAIKWALGSKITLQNTQIVFMLYILQLAMENNYFWHEKQYYKQIRGLPMGGKYVPMLANILLSKWESEEIYGRNILGLKT